MPLLITLFLSILVAASSLDTGSDVGTGSEEELLIGWKGNSYKPRREKKGLWLQLISWKPRAYILHNLITEDEARHIVELSWPKMRRSTVVGPNGSDTLDDYRTSYGTFLARHQTPVVARIQDRVAFLTRTPVVHQEDMQVLRYGVGQYYHRHTDSLDNDSPRMATLLIYLADPERGGETSFPVGSEWVDPRMAALYEPHMSQCARGHVAFRPRRGDALLFFSIRPDGRTEDPHSMHEGCAVEKGAKWTTTIWIHTIPFRPDDFQNGTFRQGTESFDPGVCSDHHSDCKMWADASECDKNPRFMKSVCGTSCGSCEPCTEEDKQARAPCYWANRRRNSYLVFDPAELEFRRSLDNT